MNFTNNAGPNNEIYTNISNFMPVRMKLCQSKQADLLFSASLIFRQNEHGNTLSWKPRIVCMTFWEKGLWNLEVIRFIKYLFYVQYWRVKRAIKNYNNNKIKTTFLTPLSYASNIYTRPHLWQISGGVRTPGPPPPLWIRAWWYVSDLKRLLRAYIYVAFCQLSCFGTYQTLRDFYGPI